MSDDFFNSVPFSGRNTNQGESVDSFAQAIAARFGSADLLTARLLPDDIRRDVHNRQQNQTHDRSTHLPKPSLSCPPPSFPLMSSTDPPHDVSCTVPGVLPTPSQSSSQPFTPIPPSALAPYLADASTLVLDIRPHAAYASARINRALSLSVPSTLLKRPLFSLSKLAQMLPSSTARAQFATWPEAFRILVYDADSIHQPENSNIAGLLRKFRAEGFTGELGWVRGGFQAVWKEAREFTTTEQPTPEDDDAESGSGSGALRTRHLPKAAFSVSSTTNVGAALVGTDTSAFPQTPAPPVPRASNPFFDVIRQNIELSQGITERIPLRLSRRVRRRISDLPFLWLREIACRSAVRHSPSCRIPGSESESSDEPHTSDPDEQDPEVEEGTEALAMQFYRIELAEQRRLQTIMSHHTRESEMAVSKPYTPEEGRKTGTVGPYRNPSECAGDVASLSTMPNTPHPSSFPFSITAGVEKGAKNSLAVAAAVPVLQPLDLGTVMFGDSGSGPGRSMGEHHGGLQGPVRSPSQSDTPTHHVDINLRMPTAPTHATPLLLHAPMDTSPVRLRPPLVSPDRDAVAPSAIAGANTTSSATMGSSSLRFPTHPYGVRSSVNTGPKTGFPIPFATAATLLGGSATRTLTVDARQIDGTLTAVQSVSSPPDDYVNASYVQPLGTRKKYIATQGPLPATFIDFWTLVWEQNVHVIVMLTREVENAMVKCGTYWTDTCYGPFRLELLSTSPPVSPSMTADTTDASRQGFFFALREPLTRSHGGRSAPTTIMRRFALSHTSYPGVPPRYITHLQYLDWPDMNVPEDPRGILDLIKRVERAVAESTPGPSPSGSGSLSPGSSLGPESISPGPSGEGQLMRKQRGRGWRHPELDPKTGVATFALGRPPPVLLHCSAGVGRTGGFIAVDAVLDGIRRELGKLREKRPSVRPGMDVRMETGGEINTDMALREAETHTSSSATGDREKELGSSMDIDKLPSDECQGPSPLQYRATAPLHVGGGDRKKGRRRYGANPSGERGSSSSESLVLHVPIATNSECTRDGDLTDMQLNNRKTTGWQASSTREWAERVSDQTHNQTGKATPVEAFATPTTMSVLPASSRQRSPGSASSSSGPSALNSADDSLIGWTGGSASGSGSTSHGGRKTGSGSASGSGSARTGPPPSSSASISNGSGSIAAPNSNSGNGSGTGSSSQIGSSLGIESSSFTSLIRSHLVDSSATSLSNISTESSPPEKPFKGLTPVRQSSALRGSFANTDTDMDVDHPPRAISVPLRRADHPPASANDQRSLSQRRAQQSLSLGSSLVASFSAPSLPLGRSTRGVTFPRIDESVLRSSSNSSSDELTSPPFQEFESGVSADAESSQSKSGSGKTSQVMTDESEGNMVLGKIERTEAGVAGSGKNDASISDGAAMDISVYRDTNGADRATLSIPGISSLMEANFNRPKIEDIAEFDPDTTVENPVIDYKPPRELHTDLSPPLLSSYQNPICTVIQDMREQRMSLCQSLRQYVFVHAAVIEGALQIVDEERELWGDSGGSDESPEFDFSNNSNDYEDPKAGVLSVAAAGGYRHPTTTTPPSAASTSPPKGKRGPSPTELLKEDMLGAPSLAKRPSIKRKSPSDDEILLAFTRGVSSANAGVSGGTVIAIPSTGEPSASERGDLADNTAGSPARCY
ncbi:hypothetical protein ID866_4860 [Astraeus odoratus]|nr:hypothetical protein ID866_4860 [Astraeus odoratus]